MTSSLYQKRARRLHELPFLIFMSFCENNYVGILADRNADLQLPVSMAIAAKDKIAFALRDT